MPGAFCHPSIIYPGVGTQERGQSVPGEVPSEVSRLGSPPTALRSPSSQLPRDGDGQMPGRPVGADLGWQRGWAGPCGAVTLRTGHWASGGPL